MPLAYVDPFGEVGSGPDLSWLFQPAVDATLDWVFGKGDINETADVASQWTPGLGDGRDVVELWTGKDAFSGEELSTTERIVTAGGALLPCIPAKPLRNKLCKGRIKRTETVVDNSGSEIGTIYIDSKGNAIPTPPGGRLEGSPDGRYIQAKDADGNATGFRIDGGHRSHDDPRARDSHGHVPDITNSDGTPWLPVR